MISPCFNVMTWKNPKFSSALFCLISSFQNWKVFYKPPFKINNYFILVVKNHLTGFLRIKIFDIEKYRDIYSVIEKFSLFANLKGGPFSFLHITFLLPDLVSINYFRFLMTFQRDAIDQG